MSGRPDSADESGEIGVGQIAGHHHAAAVASPETFAQLLQRGDVEMQRAVGDRVDHKAHDVKAPIGERRGDAEHDHAHRRKTRSDIARPLEPALANIREPPEAHIAV